MAGDLIRRYAPPSPPGEGFWKLRVSPLNQNLRVTEQLPYIYAFETAPIAFERHYFLISSDSPVISAGFSMPIISSSVGAMSARHPPSRSV